MFGISRLSPFALGLTVAVVLVPMVVGPADAATPILMDTIGPGLMHGIDGFGTSTVLVPKNGYVTYLVRTDSGLKGRRIQIWTDTGKGWTLATTRAIEADGSVHYFARVTGRIAFWAKYPDVSPAATSHGRTAAVSSDGTTTIRIACDDVGPIGTGVKSIINRTVAVRLNGTVRVVVCSNPSTGFAWGMVALDETHLLRVGHTMRAGGGTAAAGTETWSVRLKTDGIGRTTLIYSQPWRGGEKAAWTLMLTVETS